MNSSEETTNMELWNSVDVTDSDHTKPVSYGKRKFTAIEPQYQIREATKLWGPYGGKWGVKNCKYEYNSEPFKAEDGQTFFRKSEATLDAVFYYPDGDFEISTDIAYKPGNDTRKKLLTDLTTKALSKLGFNADVFMGRFDGNKYTEGQEPGNGKPPNASQTTASAVEAFL